MKRLLQRKSYSFPLFLFLLCGLIITKGFAQDYTITVQVKNVRNNHGTVRVALFKHEKEYMKDYSLGKIVNANTPEVSVIFENMPAGEYAITVFHDENSNAKLDSNFMGVPKEGIGFSNDASASFGPPSWEKAKFTLSQTSLVQVIDLKYL
jgi:uncharacterized protein (DUF2141 family)